MAKYRSTTFSSFPLQQSARLPDQISILPSQLIGTTPNTTSLVITAEFRSQTSECMVIFLFLYQLLTVQAISVEGILGVCTTLAEAKGCVARM